MQLGGNRWSMMPPVVKNLLIINGLMFLASLTFESSIGLDLNDLLGLHYFQSEKFNIFQIVSYMFMHGGLTHIFFNMFALYMFGRVLENVWGSKRFKKCMSFYKKFKDNFTIIALQFYSFSSLSVRVKTFHLQSHCENHSDHLLPFFH